jgi:DNA-binding NarL/FixJ family response regulator
MKRAESVLPNEAKTGSTEVRASMAGPVRRVVRVWVVEDDAILRQLFAQSLNQQPGIRCTRQFASAEALLATLAEERPPHVVLMDVTLGQQSGLAAIQPVKRLAPAVKVVMMTMFSNSYYEAEAFRAGASGFVLKSYEFAEIVQLIHEAHSNPRTPRLFRNLCLDNQTDLERKLADAAARGSRRRFSLVRALRQLYAGARRQTVS